MSMRRQISARTPLARVRGVTLLELMIVITVLGILAAVAYPNYRSAAARAKRSEARAALLQIATQQERRYLQNNSYTTDMSKLGFANAGCNMTGSETYSVCVTAADANNWTAVATYQNADSEAGKCSTFHLDGRGVRTSTPYTDCWSRTR